jgi:pimeloyl-ACP methyl ester carboxylesterase
VTALATRRIALSTGVSLDVTLGGPRDGEPILFLHGFPESHRTWRHQLADLSRDHFVVAPDQRGYAGSDKPRPVKAYETARIIEDAIALADALEIDRFTLVGHDWGGAAAWGTALKHPRRVARLVILNAPHPLIFQRSLIEDQAQRSASQYIRMFRNPLMPVALKAMGYGRFFDLVFGNLSNLSLMPPEERQAYLDQWSQPRAMRSMLAWYRAAGIKVPPKGRRARLPLWTHLPFPRLHMPVLVVWGMKDKALLPVQLEGLEKYVEDLRIVRIEDAGHFVPWEKPEAVTSALRAFLTDRPLGPR